MNRPVTAHEAAVVRWLLDRAPVGDVETCRARPAEELRVVGGCGCGCTSLDFLPHPCPGKRIIADAYAVYSGRRVAGLILWGCEGEIASLEVYDRHPDASHRFPEIANLRTFEDYGRECG